MQDFLRSIFSRGSFANTDSIVVTCGGVNDSSTTLTVDVNHYDASGNLKVTATGVTLSGTISAVLFAGTVSSLNYAQARTTDPAPAAANGVNTPIISDSLGKQVVLPGAVNDLHLDGQVALAGVLATAVIPAVAAGRRIAMQSILVTNSGSQTVQIIISGGPNNRTFGHAFPGGGFQLQAGGAALYITSASTALSVAGDVTATCNVFVSGYSLSN